MRDISAFLSDNVAGAVGKGRSRSLTFYNIAHAVASGEPISDETKALAIKVIGEVNAEALPPTTYKPESVYTPRGTDPKPSFGGAGENSIPVQATA